MKSAWKTSLLVKVEEMKPSRKTIQEAIAEDGRDEASQEAVFERDSKPLLEQRYVTESVH